MKEGSIQQDILLNFGRAATTRAFRNNTGTGWVGSKYIKQRDGSLLILNPRPLHAGLIKGGSDLVGWHTVRITPDMIGKRVAVFLAIETKSNPRSGPTPEQLNFINQVNLAGGIAGVARSPETAMALVLGYAGAY